MVGSLSEAQVTVVGLGLMGGSLAAALRRRNTCRKGVGVTRRTSKTQMARRLGFVDEATTDLAEGLADADVVVLATPVTDIIAKIGRLGSLLKPGALVTDVGSTKRAICTAMENLPDYAQAVGGHPMCGKESSGLAVADPALYEGKRYVLCPIPRTTPEALALGHELAEGVGAKPMVLEPDRHDWAVAIASHLPYSVAVAMVCAAEDLAGGDGLPWELAAGGFRDTSRVAASDVRMMLDILTTNRDEVLSALKAAEAALGTLSQLLQDGDDASLAEVLSAARDRRIRIYP
ncbi:MAG: prephenate dehydrogenase/arogenate dehydrogenase family protein [Anaerolineae bacterium]|nr:prephenate dehydrogenase/arogenate dehydrogenase family protein [Anaerolineae bacterium]